MKKYLLWACTALALASCTKMIAIDTPPNVLTTDKVYDSDASAVAATLGNYTPLATLDANFVVYADQYTDQLTQPVQTATTAEFASGSLTAANGAVASFWQNAFVSNYNANANLESLTAATVLTDSVRNQCMGEALFIRAYDHLCLAGTFGDVPLITTTDVRLTAMAPRTPVAQVYQQIAADLERAIPLLSVRYPSTEKIRPNRWAARALLARVRLYQQNWAQAETEANALISSGVYSLSPISGVFFKNSSEAIWQLWNTNGFSNLSTLLTPSGTAVPPYTISPSLLSAFESGDLRKTNWTLPVTVSGATYVSPYKYKQRAANTTASAEYTMYLRLAEMYLIRAEARAQQNANLSGAIADLNQIRSRAGLAALGSALGQSAILDAVAKERRIELFAEAGHRFFDLKRTGQLNTAMGGLKPAWNAARSTSWPIPMAQLNINNALTQNPGYL